MSDEKTYEILERLQLLVERKLTPGWLDAKILEGFANHLYNSDQ